jgi:hypothetical protein
MSIYDAISDALALAGEDASCICIGQRAWNELKLDPRSIHSLSLVDEALYFKGVEINPFADVFGPDSWELV